MSGRPIISTPITFNLKRPRLVYERKLSRTRRTVPLLPYGLHDGTNPGELFLAAIKENA